jgi:hypothetical protein
VGKTNSIFYLCAVAGCTSVSVAKFFKEEFNCYRRKSRRKST